MSGPPMISAAEHGRVVAEREAFRELIRRADLYGSGDMEESVVRGKYEPDTDVYLPPKELPCIRFLEVKFHLALQALESVVAVIDAVGALRGSEPMVAQLRALIADLGKP